MNWFKRLAAGVATRAAKFAGIPLRDPALVSMLGHTPTDAGVDMNESAALNLATVWQAVGIIGSNIAGLPPVPYRITDKGRLEAVDHWSWDLLLVSPNEEMTPFTFYETLGAWALTWGNGYAVLDKDTPDSPCLAMHPVPPNQMEPERDERGKVVYRFTPHFDGEEERVYQPWEVLHLAGLGWDGLRGYNVIDQARESLGLTAAVEKYGAAFYGRGTTPGGLLQLPAEMELSSKARAELRESFERLHRGPDNAHRVAILEDGIEYKTLGLPLETAQFLASRQFQVIEIARWFNLPPHMLRDLSAATYSNIEEQGLDFLTYTLRPWLIRWQQEIRRKLFAPRERKQMIVLHDTQALLAADVKARYEAYKIGRESGILTLNDIFRREGINPIDAKLGDSRLVPLTSRAVANDGADVFAENAEIEKTALSGPQVASLLSLITAATGKQIPIETAKAMIALSFPNVTADQIEAMVKPLEGFNGAPLSPGKV